MQLILFIGIQASGKSSFYKEHFFDTHIRVNLDMLKTRHREMIMINACLEGKQPFVIDNTNPTKNDRNKYIKLAKAHKFSIIGYYFSAALEDCKKRNLQRPEKHRVPMPGLIGTYNKLEQPSLDEGFDELHYVKIDKANGFIVEPWSDEI